MQLGKRMIQDWKLQVTSDHELNLTGSGSWNLLARPWIITWCSRALRPPRPSIYRKRRRKVISWPSSMLASNLDARLSTSNAWRRHGSLLAVRRSFPGGPGRTTSNENFQTILNSIKTKLLILPDNTIVHPGHGKDTNIKQSINEYNTFIKQNKDLKKLSGNISWV